MSSDTPQTYDTVERPAHYNTHPSGVECITIAEHLPANLSHALGYLWRFRDKHDPLQDLRKAMWYLQRQKKYQLNTAGARDFIRWAAQQKSGDLQTNVLHALINAGHPGILSGRDRDNFLDVAMELVRQMINEELGNAPTQLELDFG